MRHHKRSKVWIDAKEGDAVYLVRLEENCALELLLPGKIDFDLYWYSTTNAIKAIDSGKAVRIDQ